MAESVISCEHLTHFYGKRKIYEDLNFEVAPGRIVGLLGKNGTGKTTTINSIIRYFDEAGLDILLAAPTGRAAKRMSETCGRPASTRQKGTLENQEKEKTKNK